MFYRALLILACVIFPTLTAVAETPAVFTHSGVDEAIDAASEKSGLVVVDFTAEWCGPCKMMDRDTWSDPEAVAWLQEHAVSVQVDVDEDEATSQAYRVRAMPTVVAIVDGKEFERNVGYMGPDELIDWLEGVRRGESKIERLIALHGERVDENGHVDTQARYHLAEALAENGQYEKALDEYLWLWQHMLEFEPSMVGVRSSFMAGSMEELVAVHEPAKAAFAELRDQAEARLEEEPTWDDLGDWLVLNEVVGDVDKTLEWFDRIKQDPEKLQAAGRFAYKYDDLLRERGRWADLGLVIKDPMQDVRQDVYHLQMTLERRKGRPVEDAAGLIESFLDSSAQTYAACLAADRTAEARAVADFLIESHRDDDAKLAMIRMALEAGVTQPEHLDWLNEVESSPEDLRAKVESALKAGAE